MSGKARKLKKEPKKKKVDSKLINFQEKYNKKTLFIFFKVEKLE